MPLKDKQTTTWNKEQGFTLIEVLAAIVILSIVSLVLTSYFTNALTYSKSNQNKTIMVNLARNALFYMEKQDFDKTVEFFVTKDYTLSADVCRIGACGDTISEEGRAYRQAFDTEALAHVLHPTVNGIAYSINVIYQDGLLVEPDSEDEAAEEVDKADIRDYLLPVKVVVTQRENGFTLIELIAAISLFAIVAGIIGSVTMFGFQSYHKITVENKLRDEADLVMSSIITELYTYGPEEIQNTDSGIMLLRSDSDPVRIHVDGSDIVVGESRLGPGSTAALHLDSALTGSAIAVTKVDEDTPNPNALLKNRPADNGARVLSPLLRSEGGSALVLVMFIVLLLTILGMGVLSATVGGAIRTETRENDVQSLHLAQKGLDESTAYIQARLAKITDINPDKLEDVLRGLDKQGLNVSTELGVGSSGKIDFIEYKDKNVGEQTRQYYIDVEASALVNGVQRTLQQRITIDTYPDFLKYAFGSEQNVYLNGAPELKGNIYAGNKLIVSNRAEYTYLGDSNLTKPTMFPQISPNGIDAANLGEVFVQSLKNIEYHVFDPSGNGGDSKILADSPNMGQTVQDIMGIDLDKIKIKEQKKFVQINVEESFIDKLVEATSPANDNAAEELRGRLGDKSPSELTNWLQTANLIDAKTVTTPPVKPSQNEGESDTDYEARLDQYDNDLFAYHRFFMDMNQSYRVDGDLRVDGINYTGITFTEAAKRGIVPKWIVVDGNLNIVNNKPDSVSIKANILVTGDVTIKGNVSFDSTMFVLGRTTVEDAVISGLGTGTDQKELVLISKGPVLVNRIDAFTNADPAEMNAFFYTDAEANLYGVGSIFWLKGGFFSKGDLTVNAVLGNAAEPPGAVIHDELTFSEPQITDPRARERFRVIYNYNVYTDQQSSLPRVRKVNISKS
ncbi:hypothetical protein KC345_g9205 [Hortaea werneckii]|nr:hypothetical protein KC345_g9205 [Hortaea werneckii]